MTERPRSHRAETKPDQTAPSGSEPSGTAGRSPNPGTAETGQSAQTAEGEAKASQRLRVAADLLADITKQTSFLTLSATIDAVQATGSGQGFARVASELEDLAAGSVEAAEAFATGIADAKGGRPEGIEAVAAPVSRTYEVARRMTGEEPAVESDEDSVRKDAG